MNVENKSVEIIKSFFEEKYNKKLDTVEFEIPQDYSNGNLSTNIALKNSKFVSKNPMLLAEEIKIFFPKDNTIEKIEVVKPGFINIFYTKKHFKNLLLEISKDEFLEFDNKNKSINIEYVSANPTGDLHLGHARNAVFGDSLANLLNKVGYNTIKEYYINDAGVQMQMLGESVYSFYLEFCEINNIFPEKGYKGSEIKEIAKCIFNEYGDSKIKEEISFFKDFAYIRNMQEIKDIMKKLNIKFDKFSSELYYHDSKKVEEALLKLEKKDEIFEHEGAKWLNTSKYGDDKDRVLQKSDGTHTYLTSDIAYHVDKYERNSDLLINIWGGDHHGYVNRLKAAIESLGYEKNQFEVILIQMVSILNNKEKVKMSKRAGTSVRIKEILDFLNPNVLRYFFLMRSPDSQLDFDVDLAQKESSDNPVYYINYAYARINTIMKENKINLNIYENKFSLSDEKIIELMSRYKNVLENAAFLRRPHLVTNYLYDLASEFHKFYNAEKILTDDEDIRNNKLLIIQNVKKIINDGFNIIGITILEKM